MNPITDGHPLGPADEVPQAAAAKGPPRKSRLVAPYPYVESQAEPAQGRKWSRAARLAFVVGVAVAFWAVVAVFALALTSGLR